MDIVTLVAAMNGSKKYTDTVAQSLMGGVRYQGEVNYYDDLPTNAEPGDAYTVKYSGTSGTDPDGTEYTWGLNHQTQQYTWIDFSKDSYTKTETDNLIDGLQRDISEQEYNQLPASKNSDDTTYFVYDGQFDPISADDVDDTNATNKFATEAQLTQIATNTTNIGTLNTFKENTYLEKWNYATQCESIQDNTYITDIASYDIDNEAPYFVLNYVPIPEGATTVYVDCEGFEDKTSISYGFIWFKENKSVCSGSDSHGIATSKTLTVPAQARYLAITFEYVNDDYTNKPKGYYYVTDKIISERMDKVVINNESINVLSAEDTTEALNSKQDKIDSTNKLSADFVDDTNTTNKFVTDAEKTTINKAVTTDDIGLGTDYLVYNGIRVYISATEPTGDIPDGSIWFGSGAAGVGIFTVTVTADSQDNLTSDKTYSEIMAAYTANQLIFVNWVNNRSSYTLASADRIPLSEINNNQMFDFTRSYVGDGEIVVMTISIRDSAIAPIVVTNETVSTV